MCPFLQCVTDSLLPLQCKVKAMQNICSVADDMNVTQQEWRSWLALYLEKGKLFK